MIELLAALALHPPKIVQPDEGEPVAVPFHPAEQLLRSGETEDGMAAYLFRVPPNSAGAPPHVHSAEDELFYVVSGRIDVLSGEDVVSLGEGGFAALTRGHIHAFWNAADEEAVLLMATTGGFEGFFDEVARAVADDPDLTPPEVGALVARLAAARGITIRMDAVPEEASGFYPVP